MVVGPKRISKDHDEYRKTADDGPNQVLESRSSIEKPSRWNIKKVRTGHTRKLSYRIDFNILIILILIFIHILIFFYRLSDAFELVNFSHGDYIVRQGTSGDTFYIISEGQVRITKKVEGKKSRLLLL